MAGFPEQQPGVLYLTEGGQETELMYKHGHELPEFAMYPLLDDPRAVADLTDMYTRYLEIAAAHQLVALMGGLDYRASPDWASKLGISNEGLAEFQQRSIEFLRDVARPFEGQIPQILVAGVVGPRGVARAAAKAGLPLSLSFIVDPTGRLLSGPSLKEAVETVDAQAGDARPDFYGVNCAHPVEFEPALVDGPWLERLRALRPNASMKDKQALCRIGHLESGDPELLGKEMGGISRRLPHLDVWGGCCGTWDDHLGAIARELRPLESV